MSQGISHLYLSPYLQAAPGSTHGYDICDHGKISSELGGEQGLFELVDALRKNGMGHIADIVPNHMGIASATNRWWYDVLENGPSSAYSAYFDIDWSFSLKEELRDKVLLPILGVSYGQALESGSIRLEHGDNGFHLRYFDRQLPIAPCSWERILCHFPEALAELSTRAPETGSELHSIVTAIRNLPRLSETDSERKSERAREKEVIRRRLARLVNESPEVRDIIERSVSAFNGEPGKPESFDNLDALLNVQPYRLSHFRVAADEINYRRFFDINDLAALNMERDEVFRESHAKIGELLHAGIIDGARIDHSDGLYDPRRYLMRLQSDYLRSVCRAVLTKDGVIAETDEVEHGVSSLVSAVLDEEPALAKQPLQIWIEKILGPEETVPFDWPIQGTTGYDFLAMANGVFIDASAESALNRTYSRWGGDSAQFPALGVSMKRLILDASMSAELHVLALQLDRLSERDRNTRDFTLNSLRSALREVISSFPVYRPYVDSDGGPSEQDRMWINLAVGRAKRRNPAVSSEIFDFIRSLLLVELPASCPKELRAEVLRFVGKFQQVTSPVMAKGIEDTSFYVFNRLLSLNEVGAAPERFGISVEKFHRWMEERATKEPCALSALSTHDTKRGEDSRARLNVLTELPAEWRRLLTAWDGINAKYRLESERGTLPDRNTEYLIYQALVGFWPCEPVRLPLPEEMVSRFQQYVQKAIHEAKLHTSWIAPDVSYDEAIKVFVDHILSEDNAEFVRQLDGFVKRIQLFGYVNSLAQTVLKSTAPGIPDLYQGSELWNLSLVDPDNRRPVDFGLRARMLESIHKTSREDRNGLIEELLRAPEDGRVKLFAIWVLLQHRAAFTRLFTEGGYAPLAVTGERADHVIAFERYDGDSSLMVVVPRLLAKLHYSAYRCDGDVGLPQYLADVTRAEWKDTAVSFSSRGRRFPSFHNIFSGEIVETGAGDISASSLFGRFPVAVLTSARDPVLSHPVHTH